MTNYFISDDEQARRDAYLASWEATNVARIPQAPSKPLSTKVRARKPFELEARQCIIRGQRDSLGACPSGRDDNGMEYCGRPRKAKARKAPTVSNYDSLYSAAGSTATS